MVIIFDIYAAICLTFIMSVIGKGSCIWGDGSTSPTSWSSGSFTRGSSGYGQSPPTYSSFSSPSGYSQSQPPYFPGGGSFGGYGGSYSRNSGPNDLRVTNAEYASSNSESGYRSSGTLSSVVGKPTGDDVHSLIAKLKGIAESLRSNVGAMQDNRPNQFLPTPSARYNSLSPNNGDLGLNNQQGGWSDPAVNDRRSRPSAWSLSGIDNGGWQPGGGDDQGSRSSFGGLGSGGRQSSDRPGSAGDVSDRGSRASLGGHGSPLANLGSSGSGWPSIGPVASFAFGGDVGERLKELLGLVSATDDGADVVGPPQFQPLPAHPHAGTQPPGGSTWLNNGEGPQHRAEGATFAEAQGPEGAVGVAGAKKAAAAEGPVTPNGRHVGKKVSSEIKVINGVKHESTKWELTGDEQREMQAKPQGDTGKVGKFSTDPAPPSQLRDYEGPTVGVDLYSFYKSAYKDRWNDELWGKQWYMHDYRTKDEPVMDMNVVPVWDLGYTGKGIIVAVVDDGVMHGHPDLAPNHLADLSYDYVQQKPGSQPEQPFAKHSHGTKCASEISMVAGNKMCGVGMAYEAKIVGVKTGGRNKVIEFREGQGLVHRLDVIDISSNSYGPVDDGIVMQRAPHVTYKALIQGVQEGRSGKGIPYVFPAGNGREDGDHCGADAYVNSRHTIPIASASQKGKVSDYSERCAAVMATAYSSGNYAESVVSVEMANNCNTTFGGTSAAVPHATAVIALVLSAKRELTYRDVMHIITMGAEVAPLANNENTWKRNDAGFWVSNDFGFGLLNAKNMVQLAKGWDHVHEEQSCDVRINIESGRGYLATGRSATLDIQTDGCQGHHHVRWIENVEIEMSIHYGYRGALSVNLTSPHGTVSDLLEKRLKDNKNGMREWIFRTVQHWGENPAGRWELKVTANPMDGLPALTGSVDEAQISFHGMSVDPPHQRLLPRKYAAFRLPDGQTSEDRAAARSPSHRWR